MGQHSLKFVASLTVCPSDIRKIREHLEIARVEVDPLQNILITPLFAKGSLNVVRAMQEEGRHVFFDSGGYYVQIGRLGFDELYIPLLKAYTANRWASVYVLPDNVPTSQDTQDIVEFKVNETIRASGMFFSELPDEIKDRAMPVVHGHNHKQIDRCLTAYFNLGVKRIGFGSFGTGGNKNEANIASENAVNLAKYVIQVAHQHNVKVHLFGIGAPPLVAMIKGIEADTFDTSSWHKAAGFGMVSLPFSRYYNISHRNGQSEFQRGMEIPDFEHWRRFTRHQCALCDSIENLQSQKMYRAVHNLIVLHETVQMVNRHEYHHIRSIYERGSEKYRQEFVKWLQIN